ncbi:hypothetical protein MUK70_11715 [Dyadobacter chenwenxiniae]|uniref:Uncharacterized protein n=1 Tax=Dyadobacter chenwenxiniae TaxID=2906456 RepID=A0A9X1TJC7_9BACT|nr:hypothetical protein [Dyadobacter chenwenxiniae]MCF0059908.1 hypothetical protein [Dyadobacter chenwenxiniae]UON85647.1 hypothetical protein MUK70_11715 [Dyadobacter chenwenxiniae]
MNYTFEQAKQAVAERRKAEEWEFMLMAYLGLSGHKGEEWFIEAISSAMQEVCELMCNESVKDDRDALNTILESHGQYFSRTVKNRPLPFPEQ